MGGLSDVEVEKRVNLYPLAMRFCGLTMEDSVPDHFTLSRFRKLLVDKKCSDRLYDYLINGWKSIKYWLTQESLLILSWHQVHFFLIINLSYIIAEGRKEDERELLDIETEMLLLKIEESSVDVEEVG